LLDDLLRVIGGQLRHMLFGQRRQMGYQAQSDSICGRMPGR
jgi:hypothetical protein